MDLFLLPILHVWEFWPSALLATVIVLIAFRAAASPERRGIAWVKMLTGANGRLFFGVLFVAWALTFGVLLQLVPAIGYPSPYGSIALIALLSGAMIMLGFVWAVIGE